MPLPRIARIRVLVMVPTMSRPMFMPLRIRSLAVSSGFTRVSSWTAELMLMATSITAPRALTMTPAVTSPVMPMVLSPVWRSCSRASAYSCR